jgi:hypothetical protein
MPIVPIGPLAVVVLAAAAWLRPDDQRAALLTAAAFLGAVVAGARPTEPDGVGTAIPIRLPLHLSDDELRAAIAAW